MQAGRVWQKLLEIVALLSEFSHDDVSVGGKGRCPMQCHEMSMQCSYVCLYRIGLFREPVGVPLEVNAPAKTHGSNKSPGLTPCCC